MHFPQYSIDMKMYIHTHLQVNIYIVRRINKKAKSHTHTQFYTK